MDRSTVDIELSRAPSSEHLTASPPGELSTAPAAERRAVLHTDTGLMVFYFDAVPANVLALKTEFASGGPNLGNVKDMILSPIQNQNQELQNDQDVREYFQDSAVPAFVFRPKRFTTFLEMLLRGRSKKAAYLIRALIIVLGSLFVAALAQISFYFPWDHKHEVPVTFQTMAVLLLGTLAGKVLGPLAVILYLIEGAAGLPFFAAHTGGFKFIHGPTAGYLFGFIPSAFLTGFLAERGFSRRFLGFKMSLIAMIVGDLVIYFVGVPVLSKFIGWKEALIFGFVQFLPGDALKIVIAALLMPTLWRLITWASRFRKSKYDRM